MILKFLCESEQLSQLFWHRTELQQAGPSGQPGLLFISSVGDVIITTVTIREKGAGTNQELATEQGKVQGDASRQAAKLSFDDRGGTEHGSAFLQPLGCKEAPETRGSLLFTANKSQANKTDF